MAKAPITTREVFQLNNVIGGLKPGTISFKTLTMESDKYVCVRDLQPDGQTSLVVADIAKSLSERHNIKDAEAAIMHPESKVLALRSGGTLQVFDLEKRERLKVHIFADGPVVYWRWINARTVGVVTERAVYHWDIDPSGPQRMVETTPVKVFDRAPEMDPTVQILSYRSDADGTWLMLCGVARGADGTLAGKTQLYSCENAASRILEGHAGTFHQMQTPKDTRLSNVMALASNGAQGGRIVILELPSSKKADASVERRQLPLNLTIPGDFPVFCHVAPLHKILFVITSRGSVFLYDVLSGLQIATDSVSNTVVFCGVAYDKTGGVLCVNHSGSVFHISIDDDNIARYIYAVLKSPEVALRVAGSAGLTGLDDVFRAQLQALLQNGDIPGAIEVCRAAPRQSLRTPDVLQRFLLAPVPAGQSAAISQYFKAMLAVGSLNAAETIELARAVIPKGGIAFVKQQIDENKVEYSEELGDLIAAADQDLAIKVYHKAGAHHKVVNVFLTRNEAPKAVAYCKRAEYNPDWRVVLINFVRTNPKDAVALALMLHRDMGPKPLIEPTEVVEMFLPGQNIREATQFLVEVIQEDSSVATAALQTRLLEINLKHSPAAVADRIFTQNFCLHYDPVVIAPLCERAQLWQRALEGYNKIQIDTEYKAPTLPNIKRCLQHASTLSAEWLLEFFSKMRPVDIFECIKDMVATNPQGNMKVIVQAAAKFNDLIGAPKFIDLFLQQPHFDILYFYLGATVAFTRDPEVHFRYIQAAAEVGQMPEVERMTRESPCYDGERTKNYLKEKKLSDPWPFINVCDKHSFIDEMVRYLVETGNGSFVEQYVLRRNPLKTPDVIASLLDFHAPETQVRHVMEAAGAMCPVSELVQVLEDRHRLSLGRAWMEARVAERRMDTALFTALAKVYVDAGENAENFLTTNDNYDFAALGKYCESRDPGLSFLAYQRGNCHTELLDVAVKNGMWKPLAKHLIRQQNNDLWMTVLKDKSNVDQRQLIEAVRQDKFAECKVAEDVIVTVRAFMKADLLSELSAILEELVVGGRFARNRFLENLLLISAIKGRKEKVMEYVNKLQDYDAQDIATIALGAGLGDVAFAVYHKAGCFKEAVNVLLNDIKPTDVARARGYAVEVKNAAVWTQLGIFLLHSDDIHEAIDALIQARNPDFVQEVSDAAERLNEFGALIKYLNMARAESKTKDPRIDTSLVLTFAKTGRLSELEEFLKTAHGVQVMGVADKCFNDGLYDSARVLYTAASNFPRLASTYIKLENYSAAVEAATKAQATRTWKEVNVACLLANELKFAATAAQHLATQPDELPDLVRLYESAGLHDELLNVMKAASGVANVHMALFTELGVLYAKYRPERLLEHIKMNPKKLNTHRLITACTQFHHWVPLRVLYINNEDWLSAAQSMMEHPADSWDHEIFKDVLLKLGSSDICYSAIGFYLQHTPEQLHDMLTTISKKIDTERVMGEVKKCGAPLSYVRPFLEATQDRNARKVNDALNQLYVEEEDFAALRRSVDTFTNFDSAELSAQLEKLAPFEFRRIALALHRRNKRYFHAIEVAKANALYSEAIESAAEGRDKELVKNLAVWFCERRQPDCLAALLYGCYDLVDNYNVMEWAWLYGMDEAVKPYLIQHAQETQERLATLERGHQEAQKAAKTVGAASAGAATAHPATLMIQGAPPGNF